MQLFFSSYQKYVLLSNKLFYFILGHLLECTLFLCIQQSLHLLWRWWDFYFCFPSFLVTYKFLMSEPVFPYQNLPFLQFLFPIIVRPHWQWLWNYLVWDLFPWLWYLQSWKHNGSTVWRYLQLWWISACIFWSWSR